LSWSKKVYHSPSKIPKERESERKGCVTELPGGSLKPPL
jgi:hypothetical protein